MKALLTMMVLAACATAKAEWYVITKVHSYNVVEAQLSKGTGSKSGIKIRINNLEKIEYITNDRAKVLLGGAEPKKILEEMVLGQIVWIDELRNEGDENIGNLYPSYEQVAKVYMKRHMMGSYSVPPQVKQKLISVQKKMISLMKNASPSTNAAGKTMSYENDYSKALFVYDGMNWFKKTGQFLPGDVQALYVGWLADYLNSKGSEARDLEVKITDMQRRSDLYRDFLFSE